MSQNPIVELKEEDRKLLRSVIDALTPKPASPSSMSEVTTSAKDELQTKKHNTIEEMIDCPDCFPSLREKVLTKHRELTKNLPLICEGCGSGVQKEWEECPICKGKHAKSR